MAIRSFIFVLCFIFINIAYSRHHHRYHDLNKYQVRQLWDIIKEKLVDNFNFDNRHFNRHEILLFPDIAFQPWNNSDTWKIVVHGWKYENERHKSWLEISAHVWLEKLTKNIFSQDDLLNMKGSINYDRLKPFFATDESDKSIKIVIGNHTQSLLTDEYGQFFEQIEMTNDDVQRIKSQHEAGSVIAYQVMSDENKQHTGIIRLIEPRQGISIISDIDDTIKISEVFDKLRLLANTFIFPFKPVPGMSDLYRQWQKHNKNCTFHYLSSMPDQLYTLTQEFIDDNKFPNGSFHMRHFGLAIGSLFSFLQPEATFNHKMKYLRFFLSNTIRDYILVGDSGEKDPEIYGEITREYPERIRAIFIRAVKDESFKDERFVNAFQGILEEKWLVFDDPKQLPVDLSKAPRIVIQ